MRLVATRFSETVRSSSKSFTASFWSLEGSPEAVVLADLQQACGYWVGPRLVVRIGRPSVQELAPKGVEARDGSSSVIHQASGHHDPVGECVDRIRIWRFERRIWKLEPCFAAAGCQWAHGQWWPPSWKVLIETPMLSWWNWVSFGRLIKYMHLQSQDWILGEDWIYGSDTAELYPKHDCWLLSLSQDFAFSVKD